MTTPKASIPGFRCLRCGHEWVPRYGMGDPPGRCPRCKTFRWDRPPHRRKAKP